jgi:mannan endo-1,4-beta-mannosidase
MLFALLALGALAATPADFVQVKGTGFTVGGKPYRYIGANFWPGMNLGIAGAAGDRARLARELDRLHAMGVDNLRIMAATEGPDGEPWRIQPALVTAPGQLREDVLVGLDHLLVEMGRRGMRAVVCLSNFWPWSGGMSQYLAWAGAGAIPYPPPAVGGDWARYQTYTERFYENPVAVAAQRETARRIITRVSSLTGLRYVDDPTIMAWQLANEPRGGTRAPAFRRWLHESAAFIKGLDPRHLVTTGVEGETPWPTGSGLELVGDHDSPHIDYATAHVWAQNWGWFDPSRARETYGVAVSRMRSYIEDHERKARRLGKPLVIEEFGIGRDGGSYDPSAALTVRDRYYEEVFSFVESLSRTGAVAGANFWAWSGEGLPRVPGGHWGAGDPFTGDPPHEAQGWYGVYAQDASTIAVISRFARSVKGAPLLFEKRCGAPFLKK